MTDLYKVMKSVNIDLSEKQAEQFDTFYDMLVETNKVMNLTAITEYYEVLIKHFADSAAIHNVYDMSEVKNLVDIGSGAGFPGIVLKILYPEIKMTLLDSLNKRVVFLKKVIAKLGLCEIEAVHGRAEDFANNILYREKFDLCLSRAVARLASLSEFCIPFVKIGGAFVSYKADACEDEVAEAKRAITLMGGKIKGISEYVIQLGDLHRKFVIIEKVKPTAAKYPRKAGVPSKEPLI